MTVLQSRDKLLIRALSGEKTDRIPFWLMRQAGRYLPEYRELRDKAGGFLDLCFNPELAAEVTMQPVRRFHMDAAILFSDILVIPYALGQKLEFRESEGPALEPIRDISELPSFDREKQRQRLSPVYETLDCIGRELPDETALIGFAGAPWTIATYMVEGGSSRDYRHVKGWAWRAPEEFKRLIGLLSNAISDHLIAQADAGAEAVQIFDTWCGVLPDDLIENLSIKPIRHIASEFKKAHPDVPVIVFPRGAANHYETFAAMDAVDAVGLDSAVVLSWARTKLQPHAALQGNLDPILLVEGGDAMENRIDEILSELGRGPLVFNLGHGILPITPPENVEALAGKIRDWQAGS